MKNLFLIFFILLMACSKEPRFKIEATGVKYSLSIESNNEVTTYNNIEGRFKKIIRSDKVALYVTPITGQVTVELIKNGSVCNGVYDMEYDPNKVTEVFMCE